MIDRTRKLRWRRRYKQSKKQAGEISQQAEKSLDKHLFRRLENIVGIRRFVFVWFLLLTLLVGGVVAQTRGLSQYYQEKQPIAGGTYTEGVLGAFTDANPLYSTSSVDTTVARLVFSSLMQYDSNNQLVGDIADKLDVNDRVNVYTAHLKHDILWHDGKPLTAADVVFTYQTIQNPDAKSPLLPNWQGVKIEAKDAYTVVFTLPHPLASFPHSLTNGIVPKHLLGNIPASSLRSVSFNTDNPVGSGPFKWSSAQVSGDTPETREEQVGLVRNDAYHFGAPKLERFTVRAFHNEDSLARSIDRRELSGASGLDTLTPELQKNKLLHEYSVPLMGETVIFLRNSNEILKDPLVRKALTRATNIDELILGLGYPVIKADGPLLRSHIGYNKSVTQPGFDIEQAKQLFAQAGWTTVNKKGIRTKDGKELTIRMFSKSNTQYAYLTGVLQKQWRAAGVNLDVVLQTDEDLKSTIAFHNYDALLYGITLGSDPDVYAYWHSSQADVRSSSRLNLSEYKSSVADSALEGGRSRVDPTLRAIKYLPFLNKWKEDAPAIALYQPRFLYVTSDKVYGFAPTKFNTPIDRFANVHNWAIREAYTTVE